MKGAVENVMPRGPAGTGRLGRIEFLAMNNPVRRFLQKHVEFRFFRDVLRAHSIDLVGGVVMDAGCGSGYGTGLIVEEYAPSRIVAFDLMPEQIELARKNNPGIDFYVGDMNDINVPDGTCDAVFVFGVFHHIQNWKGAIREAARTLAPGGVLLVEEPPYGFTWRQFEEALGASGFTLLESRNFYLRALRGYLWQKQDAVGHSLA